MLAGLVSHGRDWSLDEACGNDFKGPAIGQLTILPDMPECTVKHTFHDLHTFSGTNNLFVWTEN